jgi:hypothetical protein
MGKTHEGIHRLSIAVGIVAGVIFFFVTVINIESEATKVSPLLIPLLLLVSAVVGCAGWGLVRFVWWVVQGFRSSSPR